MKRNEVHEYRDLGESSRYKRTNTTRRSHEQPKGQTAKASL